MGHRQASAHHEAERAAERSQGLRSAARGARCGAIGQDQKSSGGVNMVERYGRWSPIRQASPGPDGLPRMRCRCDCGVERDVYVHSLRAGRSKSCGCLQREIAAEKCTRHGVYDRRTYWVWRDMLRRCRDPKHRSFGKYGAAGVTVCERWTDVRAFVADMGERPPETTLDRIDPHGNYEPQNCRWATRLQQARNKRGTIFVECDGEIISLAEALDRHGISECRSARYHWRRGRSFDWIAKNIKKPPAAEAGEV